MKASCVLVMRMHCKVKNYLLSKKSKLKIMAQGFGSWLYCTLVQGPWESNQPFLPQLPYLYIGQGQTYLTGLMWEVTESTLGTVFSTEHTTTSLKSYMPQQNRRAVCYLRKKGSSKEFRNRFAQQFCYSLLQWLATQLVQDLTPRAEGTGTVVLTLQYAPVN